MLELAGQLCDLSLQTCADMCIAKSYMMSTQQATVRRNQNAFCKAIRSSRLMASIARIDMLENLGSQMRQMLACMDS